MLTREITKNMEPFSSYELSGAVLHKREEMAPTFPQRSHISIDGEQARVI